jgi:hypothetical protein
MSMRQNALRQALVEFEQRIGLSNENTKNDDA